MQPTLGQPLPVVQGIVGTQDKEVAGPYTHAGVATKPSLAKFGVGLVQRERELKNPRSKLQWNLMNTWGNPRAAQRKKHQIAQMRIGWLMLMVKMMMAEVSGTETICLPLHKLSKMPQLELEQELVRERDSLCLLLLKQG
jgi:hypothetical protein